MTLYLVPYCLPLLIGFWFSKGKGTLILFGLFLTLLIGLKGDIDKDYLNYQIIYDAVPPITDGYSGFAVSVRELNIEIGFLFLVSTLKACGFGLSSVFFVVGGASAGLIYYCSKKFNENIFLIFAFLYSVSFIGLWVQIRYGLASIALLSALLLLSEKKLVGALILFCFSVLFHGVAWIAIFVIAAFLFIQKTRLNKKQVAVLIAFIAIGFSFFEPRGVLVEVMSLANKRYLDYAYDIEGSRLSFYARVIVFFLLLNLIQLTLVTDSKGVMLFIMVILSLLAWSVAWSIGILYRVGTSLEMGYILFLLRSYYVSDRNYALAVILLIALSAWRIYIAVGELSNYQSSLPLP